jgi:hypothetical protein
MLKQEFQPNLPGDIQMRIENLSKQVDMTAVHGGATNYGYVGGLNQTGVIGGPVLGVGFVGVNSASLSQNASDTTTYTSDINQAVSAVNSIGTGGLVW